MKVNNKLSSYEVFSLTNLLIAMCITNTTPSLLAQTTQNAFWLVPLISFVSTLPPLLILLYLVNKYNAEHLVDLLEKLLGKVFGKVMALVLFIPSFFVLAFQKRSYVGQIKILYFEQSPIVVIFGLLTIICVFGAVKGIKVIGYTAKILLPFFQVSLIILIILIYPSLIIPERIFPIYGSGLSNLIQEGFLKGSLFSSFFLLLMIMPAIRKPKDFYKGGLTGLSISMIEMTLFFFIYTTFFDYNSIRTTPFPFHEITQFVRLGEFFTNIETFFLIFWLLSMFVRIVLFIYLIAWGFGTTFNIKQFELLIFPLGFLLMIIGLLPANPTVTETLYLQNLYSITTFTMGSFPFILLIFHFFKRVKERSK